MAFTLANAQQFLRDYDFDNNGARGARIYIKICNDALRELYATGDYDFCERVGRFTFAAPYNTGTVSVSAAGTAITGVGTTFTAAMVGLYMRFNNEAQQYLITAYTSATSITCDAYLGAADLSAVTYQITDERKALSTLTGTFRSFKRVLVDSGAAASGPMFELRPTELKHIYEQRLYNRMTNVPRLYSVQWFPPSSGNVPLAHMFIYPPPDVQRIVTVFYDVWHGDLAVATDEFQVPREGEGVVREFLLWALYREQGRKDEAQAQLQKAKSEARQALGATRALDNANQKRAWTPESDDLVNGPEYYWPRIDPATPQV